MRVALDARLYGLQHRGLGRYLVELVAALAEHARHDEFILLLDPRNAEHPPHLPPNFSTVAAPARVYTAAEQLVLPPLVRRLKPDLTHYPHFSVPLAAPTPFVVTVHDLILHSFPTERATTLPRPLYRAKLAGYHLVVRQALKRASRVLTVSQAVANEIVRYYPWAGPKISVVPLAPGRPSAPVALNLARPYVLAVGAAYPHKNLERAIAAVALARQELSNLTFVLVGRRDVFMERLAQYVARGGYDSFVRLWGEATEPELAALYRGAAAYLVPSLAEGFGLGALEALQQGCPVVAADIPVLREVLGGAAEYADPFNVQSLAQATVRAVRGVNQGVRAAAAVVLGRYSWAATAAGTLAAYRAALG